jgi:hypothetical protein
VLRDPLRRAKVLEAIQHAAGVWLVLGVLVVAAACGGNGGDSLEANATRSGEGLIRALYDGDGDKAAAYYNSLEGQATARSVAQAVAQTASERNLHLDSFEGSTAVEGSPNTGDRRINVTVRYIVSGGACATLLTFEESSGTLSAVTNVSELKGPSCIPPFPLTPLNR